LGRYLAGALLDDVGTRGLYWPSQTLTRHALVLGAPGSGKSETVLRMAFEMAGLSLGDMSVQVIYFDAKNDPVVPGRFGGVMKLLGRETMFFPEQRINLWQGDWRAVKRRLMRIVPYEADGAASYYRDIARVVIEYICVAWEEPPRSSAEVFARLREASVQDALNVHPLLAGLESKLIDQVLMRYQAFWGGPGLVFDGTLAFEDIETGYFRIDPDILGDEADYALCMLFLDFVHYCKMRKPRSRHVVLVLDEFSAIANAFEMDRLAEELRSFNVTLVFVPQSIEGMGSENQRWRLFKAARLKVVHRYEDPMPFVEVLGKRKAPDYRFRPEDESGLSDQLSWVERWRIPPEWFLDLGIGEAVVIREGHGTKVMTEMVEAVESVDLPPSEAIDRRYNWRRSSDRPDGSGSVDPAAFAQAADRGTDSAEPDVDEVGTPPGYVLGDDV
jgi:hypothetical protein